MIGVTVIDAPLRRIGASVRRHQTCMLVNEELSGGMPVAILIGFLAWFLEAKTVDQRLKGARGYTSTRLTARLQKFRSLFIVNFATRREQLTTRGQTRTLFQRRPRCRS